MNFKDKKGQFVIDFSQSSRKQDPATSKKAEKKITESGSRKSHCRTILECLKKHNGSTSKELAQYLYGVLSHDQIWRRRKDLIESNYIRIAGVRNGFGIWWLV